MSKREPPCSGKMITILYKFFRHEPDGLNEEFRIVQHYLVIDIP